MKTSTLPALLLAVCAATAQAQSTPIVIGLCSGSGGQDSVSTNSCVVAPYGTMALSIQIAAVAKGVYEVTFQFNNATEGFTAVDPSQAGVDNATSGQITGTAAITSASGALAGATGSLNYTLSGVGSYAAQAFTLTGSGTLGQASACANTGLQLSLDNIQEMATGQGIQQENGTFPATAISLGNCSAASTAYTVTVPPATQYNGINLVIAPLSGTIPAGSSAMLTVTISLLNTQPGTYVGSFGITSTAAGGKPVSQAVVIDATISGGPLLQLSTTGITLNVTAGGSLDHPGTIDVLVNGLAGSVPFTATATTASGGGWLQVTPGAASVSSSSPATLTVNVASSGLKPGNYFGRIDVAATGVVNSPQSVEVILLVGTGLEGPDVTATLAPTGLAFVSTAGSTPAPQAFSILNTSPTATISPAIFVQYAGEQAWLTASLSTTTPIQPGQSANVTVTPNVTGLASGLYVAGIYLQISPNYVINVKVGLVVVSPPAGAKLSRAEPEVSASCTPTQLFAAFTDTPGNFQEQSALPVALQAIVLDDCGNPLNSGSVVATFSTGDQPATLIPIGNGVWSGTWLAHNSAGGPAVIALYANSPNGGISGTTSLTGTLTPNTTVPVLSASAPVVNGASFALNQPISPGSFVSLFGANLAAAAALQNSTPYPSTLGGTQVLLGGVAMPLQYTGTGQINAIVPWEVPVNATMQLIVEQNGMSSMPEPVNIVPATPAVFTANATGSGPGAIVIVHSNGSYLLPGQGPATAGDVLEIYATGLGTVNATVADGAASPSSPPDQTTAPVTVTIGGVNAPVGFAGLAPGFAGLYQVNVTVPAGITPGASVPIVLTQGNYTSPAVTIGIQ